MDIPDMTNPLNEQSLDLMVRHFGFGTCTGKLNKEAYDAEQISNNQAPMDGPDTNRRAFVDKF